LQTLVIFGIFILQMNVIAKKDGRGRPTSKHTDEIIFMLKNGATPMEIMNRLPVSSSRIFYHSRKIGLKFPPGRYPSGLRPSKKLIEILEEIKSGLRQVDVAKKLSVSRQFVNQIINSQKAWARKYLCSAVNQGRVFRPGKCQECDSECVPHGHHNDYSKPLQIVWLCSKCHGKKSCKN
jgi:DNA-binding CsgD family transcriptional regulator